MLKPHCFLRNLLKGHPPPVLHRPARRSPTCAKPHLATTAHPCTATQDRSLLPPYYHKLQTIIHQALTRSIPFAMSNVTFCLAKRILSPCKTLPFARSGMARAVHKSCLALQDTLFRPAALSPSARQTGSASRPNTPCKTKKAGDTHHKNGEYPLHCQALATRLWRLLAVMLVRNGELLATLGAAGGQNATAILRGHSLTEAVLVHTTAVVGLKCSFHLLYFLFIVI